MAVGERPTTATRTIPALWRRAATAGHRSPAYLVQGDSGWEPVSWEEAARRIDELSHGFLASGLRKGDAFAILGTTRLEWALVNFALAQIGVAVIPVYPTSSPADCGYVLGHSEAVGIICEDEEMQFRVQDIRGETSLET